jgi:hypothetical protein
MRDRNRPFHLFFSIGHNCRPQTKRTTAHLSVEVSRQQDARQSAVDGYSAIPYPRHGIYNVAWGVAGLGRVVQDQKVIGWHL